MSRVLALGALTALAACSVPQVAEQSPAQKLAARKSAKLANKACASAVVYERIKSQAFREASAVYGDRSTMLDRLAGEAIVRMDSPFVKGSDPTIGVTICGGTFSVELPPGFNDLFDGDRRLTAEVEYASQPAADGSGLVFRVTGAEPVIYRLAAVALREKAKDEQLALAEEVPDALAAATPPEPRPAVFAPVVEPVPPAVAKVQPKPALQQVAAAPVMSPARPASKPKPSAKPVALASSKPAAKRDAKPAAKPKPAKLAKVEEKRRAKPAKPEPARKERLASRAGERKPARAKTTAPKPAKALAAAKPDRAKPERVAARKKPAPERLAKAAPKPSRKPVAARTAAKPKTVLTAGFAKALRENAKREQVTSAPKPARATPKPPAPKKIVTAARPAPPRTAPRANGAITAKERRVRALQANVMSDLPPAGRRAIQQSSARFESYRRGCRNEACVSQAYDDRVAEIDDIVNEYGI